jgi:hypothetical protein
MNTKHIGSDFDDFLREESLLEDSEATAAKRVVAFLDSEAEILRQNSEFMRFLDERFSEAASIFLEQLETE